MRTFLQQLFEAGRVTVPLAGQNFEESGAACEREIRAFDRSARMEGPAGLPALNGPVAAWAAERLAEICRLVIAREAGPDEFGPAFGVACPAAKRTPEVEYSADLFFRHLPELATLTERLSPGDPLLVELSRLAGAWPLSSVGMKLPKAPEPARMEVITGHQALLRLYVDRVLATEDQLRLSEPAVERAVCAALGAHPELSPALARELENLGNSTCPARPLSEAQAPLS